MSATNGAAASGLADVLKAETAEAHRAAESHSFQQSLVRGTVSRSALLRHQAGQLELIRAVASRLGSLGAAGRPFAEALNAHATRLESDLVGLRNGEPDPPPSAAVREFTDRLGGASWPAEASLGVFYVIEGSMNGNRFIRRALTATRPELADHLDYFDPYGDDQRETWRRTRSEIDRVGAGLDQPQVAARAARAAFALAEALASEVAGEA